jgi:hypothetical protein
MYLVKKFLQEKKEGKKKGGKKKSKPEEQEGIYVLTISLLLLPLPC